MSAGLYYPARCREKFTRPAALLSPHPDNGGPPWVATVDKGKPRGEAPPDATK